MQKRNVPATLPGILILLLVSPGTATALHPPSHPRQGRHPAHSHARAANRSAQAGRRRTPTDKAHKRPTYTRRPLPDAHAETDFQDANDYYLRQRAFPFAEVDWSAYGRAVQHRDRMPVAGEIVANEVLGAWTFQGPTGLQSPYTTYYGPSPVAGRVNGIAIDPKTPGTYYVAAAGGGVWKTTDGGVNWSSLTDLDPQWKYQQASSVALDPNNPTTIYAATGDSFYFGSFQPNFIGNGILKSTDGGATWAILDTSAFGTLAISHIAVDPDAPNIVTASTGNLRGSPTGYLYRSTDAGATWSQALDQAGCWTDIAIGAKNPTSGQRYYYASGFKAPGASGAGLLYRSSDQGASWLRLQAPVTSANQQGIDVCCSPVNVQTVYLLSGGDKRVYKSTDAGVTWTTISAGMPGGDGSSANPYNWTQSWYDYAIACSRTPTTSGTADVLYVSLIDVVASPNGGSTWYTVGGPTYSAQAVTHNDQHAIAIDPAHPGHVLIGNDGGIYNVNFKPGGLFKSPTWSVRSLNKTLGITQFYKFDIDALELGSPLVTSAGYVGGAQDNAVPFRSTSGGWPDVGHWPNVGAGDGGWTAVNPDNSNVQYVSSQSSQSQTTNKYSLSIRRTRLHWANFWDINPNIGNDVPGFIYPLVLDPSDPDFLYVATDHLYRWDEGFLTGHSVWTNSLGGQPLAGAGMYVLCVAVAADGSRIYTGSVDGQIWMSKDSGMTWRRIDLAPLPVRAVTSISIDPLRTQGVIVGLSGTGSDHVWQCLDTDAAAPAWSSISGAGASALPDIPVNSLVRSPWDPVNKIYAGTDVGVFNSYDGGQTWTNATQPLGLPNVQVNDLKIDEVHRQLVAATFGRGIWTNALQVLPTYDFHDFGAGVGFPGGVNRAGQVTIGQDTGINWGTYLWPDPQHIMPDHTSPLLYLGKFIGNSLNNLNNSGDATGPNEVNGSDHDAIVYHRGALFDLGTWIPTGINDIGQVTGQMPGSPSPWTAILWTPANPTTYTKGKSTNLGTGWYPNAINNYGQVIGTNTPQDAILWTPATPNGPVGTMRDISNDLPGGPAMSTPYGINDMGVVTGNVLPDGNTEYAFVWTPQQKNGTTGTMILLPSVPGLPSGSCYASAINNRGDVVGYISPNVATKANFATLWTLQADGTYTATDLNTLVPPGIGLQLESATGINDAGQIVGYGYAADNSKHPFLLTPQ
jgi:photosystem II stability/assembly factor-like uncharacterized protein